MGVRACLFCAALFCRELAFCLFTAQLAGVVYQMQSTARRTLQWFEDEGVWLCLVVNQVLDQHRGDGASDQNRFHRNNISQISIRRPSGKVRRQADQRHRREVPARQARR
jgi:hypothetical protein